MGSAILFLTLVAVFGTAFSLMSEPESRLIIFEASSRESVTRLSKPSGRRYQVICQVLPKGGELQWKGPSGNVIKNERLKQRVKTMKMRDMLLLTFMIPLPEDSGTYTCSSANGEDGIKEAAVHIEFEYPKCPRDAYPSSDGAYCQQCPANSYTSTSGVESVSDCLCYPGFKRIVQSGRVVCTDVVCAVDTYLSRNGKNCRHCPQNSYTTARGAVSISDCLCKPGFERTVHHGRVTCTDVFHYASPTCPLDWYLSPDGTRCNKCPLNSYTTAAGAASVNDCLCRSGFQRVGHFSGFYCIDINECDHRNFGCSHTCSNTPGSAFCSCPSGFRLDVDGKQCIDVDECSSEESNKCNQKCSNTIGSYACSCLPGYILTDDFHCEECRPNSFRSAEDKYCSECPENSMTDGHAKTSIADCECIPGFYGDPGRQIPCVDIDECADNSFSCSHECVNTPGSAHCSCPRGLELDSDGKTCIDIDECLVNNGGCEGECENFEGGFQCSCSKGYELVDLYTCTDINECVTNNGGCGQNCVNFRGGHYCTCDAGYRLDSDQKSCIANHCPRVLQPQHSSMKCYKKDGPNLKNELSLPIAETYANGTVCLIKCDRGYKAITSDNKIRCQENGQWSAMPTKCLAKHCSPLPKLQNGEVYPRSCRSGGAIPLTRCTFACHNGYKLKGPAMLRCSKNLEWLPKKLQQPVCEPVIFTPYLTCPEDITTVLDTGHNSTSIIIPKPQATGDVGDIEVSPGWVNMDSESVFPAGVTDITFTVHSTINRNITGSCTLTVTIADAEPPSVLYCPESFTVEAESSLGANVQWAEPLFSDNVMVQTVSGSMRSNTTLLPGLYSVMYVATDSSGNEEYCEFVINVTSPLCGYPNGPLNGQMSCTDWMFGRLCTAACDAGFALYPPEPSVFTCDDSGVWEPSDVVQDCMRALPPSNSSCPDGYELLPSDSSEICVECPAHFPWSLESRTCMLNISTVEI